VTESTTSGGVVLSAAASAPMKPALSSAPGDARPRRLLAQSAIEISRPYSSHPALEAHHVDFDLTWHALSNAASSTLAAVPDAEPLSAFAPVFVDIDDVPLRRTVAGIPSNALFGAHEDAEESFDEARSFHSVRV